MEALEEIKKLNSEKIELYERMLKDKTEMIEKIGTGAIAEKVVDSITVLNSKLSKCGFSF